MERKSAVNFMKFICLNCDNVGKYKVPRDFIEGQLGWKLDLPADGKRVWRQYGTDDVYLCRECLLNVMKTKWFWQQYGR